MGKGFLGTPASLMLDVVVCSLIVVVPALLFSIYVVRYRKAYQLHKRLQITLFWVLAVAVTLFEVDMRLSGGFWKMAEGSRYFDTAFLKWLLWVHLFFSITTAVLWVVTFVTAIKKFPNPPGPGAFSRTHLLLGRIAVIDMVATVVTGLMVYYYGFMALK